MIEKAILFAIGPGGADRLTANRLPFPCIPIANRTLVEHSVERLREAGARSIAIVAEASDAAEVRRSVDSGPGAEDILWIEHEADDPGLHERLAEFAGGKSCVLHLGDNLIRTSLSLLLAAFRGGRYDCLEIVRGGRSEAQVTNLFAGREGGNGQPRHERLGVCVLGPGFADAEVDWSANGHFDGIVESIIGAMLAQGGTRDVTRVAQSWRFQSTPRWILSANRFALQSLTSKPVPVELADTDIDGVVDIDPTAKIESSVVRGPVAIGAGAHIKDSYIGPSCSIGDHVEIEGSEVEDSVILSGASVRHLGNRLEASVIGPGARVHREFRLPRGLRLDVGRKAEVSLS